MTRQPTFRVIFSSLRRLPAAPLMVCVLSLLGTVTPAQQPATPPGPQSGTPQNPSTQSPPKPDAGAPPSQKEAAGSKQAEVVTRDSATTFKVRVNLVQVRVVVRDDKGKIVEGLK